MNPLFAHVTRLRIAAALLAVALLSMVGGVTLGEIRPRVDNPHGKFREECSLCHGADSWKIARIGPKFDHGKYGFRLEGAHAAAPCMACHTSLEFSQARTQCVSCHQDPHRGEMGIDCARCHGARSFTDRGPMVRAHQLTRFPLTGGHASLDCESCHQATAEGHLQFVGTRVECKTCHMPQFQSAKNPDHVAGGYPLECQNCHSGTGWNAADFNHDITRFPLTGAHVTTACAGCHGDGVYAGKPTTCISCHQSTYDTAVPPHVAAGFAASACATCHTTAQWAGGVFDHNATPFPLTGAHVATACSGCHGDGVYAGKPTTCISCHQSTYDTATPPHLAAGFAASACATCHTTAQWARAPFDHNATQFPLTGAHIATACAGCHGDGVYAGKPTTCISCHQSNYTAAAPPHNTTSFPTAQCATCHNTTTFANATFDHNATPFPLTGAHVTTACAGCHGDGVYAGKPTTCISCHQSTYDTAVPPHVAAGFAASACATCHTTAQWAGGVFDHNATPFPLTGAHVATACAGCHGDGVYAGKPTTCISCHQSTYDTATPPHLAAGFAASACATCHTTAQWARAAFDHNATQFPLTGAHIATACAGCHGDGVYVGKPTTCISCHQSNYTAAAPPHNATSFPAAQCATCHNTTTFANATFNHNATQFPLTGAHVTTACAGCHGDGVYAGKPTTCISCHQSTYDTAVPPHVAAGFAASACATCHTTAQWAGGVFDHNATPFPLTGAHVATACSGCHGDGVYAGKPTTCISCHQSTYDTATPPHVAAGFAASACATCHTTAQWARAPFDHNATQFPLTGAHVATACAGCHGDGVYVGKPTTCISCHQSNYTAAVPPHNATSFPTAQCATCHNTTTFANATFDHNATPFPLTGAHVATACAGCHGDGVYAGKPTTCISCHQSTYDTAVPPHVAAGFAASACATCHTTAQWAGGVFDHNATPFPLTGAHVATACSGCHGDGVYAGKPTTCISCHQSTYDTATPPHLAAGFAASACATCHTTAQWARAAFDHNATQFPLTGAHVATACAGCHGDGVYVGKPTTCISCHQSNYTAAVPPHNATSFPTAQCATCHNTTTFANATFDHNATLFPLTGAHVATACAGCHGDGVYAGKPTTCISCHQSDYNTAVPPHAPASFPTAACGTCHNTTTFANATFDHSATQFPLTGAHVAVACAGCHGDGVFAGKPTTCISCHQANYDGASPNHAAAGFAASACTTCHNTTAWTGAKYTAHDAAYFPVYSGRHNGTWSTCDQCHTNATNFAVFTCLSCHPHDNKTQTDSNHSGRSGYSYDSNACYRCHPTGSSG